ncbi:uncharacterized protein LOC111265913 isoform X2 [Varroa jacobsoni]|uniref:uncharacterized protein LOC111265913 isoform X2 n=1 Tax=Varroa jacobsoni TaxID=62625 RepID=UPI000BF43D20|nr:uncharacterized protein LOC111265913 isoform X2 [Varroa jacobsoni]
MRAERSCSVQSPIDGTSTNDESSPSWASCSSTPSYMTSGLAFEFNHKCTISEESLHFLSTSSDHITSVRPLSPSDHCSFLFGSAGASARRLKRGSRASCDGQLGGDPASSGDGGVPGEDIPCASGSVSRLSHFLKRTQSVTPPAHALFLRKPVSKTKSADIACDEPRKKTLAQDVRLRLGFLRRRNTDTSIRPPPEEAQKWAQSFVELTNSKYGLALFRAFLSREFSEENIDFWLAIEDFKKMSTRPHKLQSKARKIFEDFVAVQSPKEVNLEASTRNAIQPREQIPGHVARFTDRASAISERKTRT